VTIFLKGNEHGSESRLFDFRKVVPYPQELLDLWVFENKALQEKDEKKKEEMLKQVNAESKYLKQEYGVDNTYAFHIEKWGTKWNACDVTRSDIKQSGDVWSVFYYMQTAWSPPMPVYLELSKKFKNITISIDCSDEGSMYNPFHAVIKNGVIVEEFEIEPDDQDEIPF
jgi:hypothetical protein